MAQWWEALPPEEACTCCSTTSWVLGVSATLTLSLQAGLVPHAAPGSAQASAWRYLPSVTLRQHRLLFLFPLDFPGSGRGLSVLALVADSAPKSCSQQ
jgi:hypothetical protein